MDIIRLLSDSIANQIAAGEVVQRPASVVKELLENSLDAGATTISLILKEAGRVLIQVNDDGKGMSPTDARMSFERHATSKIQNSEDLFNIRTMGFRGEALASIAAIAQVEMKTKRREDELATLLKIEGSQIKDQSFGQAVDGTQISVKNLFFNVPARRNFLKSNPVEMKHILDEFQRVALAHPEVKFSLYHNDQELYKLPSTTIPKRIVDVLDASYRDQMAHCEVDTDYVKISGYIGKPQMAKKTKGDQFFFVNKRFIKSSYLHHAILKVYEGVISEGHSPFYVLFLEIDPKHIDINIHPTKTEIKFDDEKTVYAILRSGVAKSLGQYHMTPTIDFNSDINTDRLSSFFSSNANQLSTTLNRTGSSGGGFSGGTGISPHMRDNTQNWQKMFDGFTTPILEEKQQVIFESKANELKSTFLLDNQGKENCIQIHNKYVLTQVKSGLMLIDQKKAFERIFYEKYLKEIQLKSAVSQQLLFPKTVSLGPGEFAVAIEILEMLNESGFALEEFGHHTLKINGVPSNFGKDDEVEVLKGILLQYQQELDTKGLDKKEKFTKTLAKRNAARMQKTLDETELSSFIHQLFETAMPSISPDGEPVLKILALQEIASLF
ncbi:MAG: DNA mismatch repair endonuclease MutL [Leadbetterella sp.]